MDVQKAEANKMQIRLTLEQAKEQERQALYVVLSVTLCVSCYSWFIAVYKRIGTSEPHVIVCSSNTEISGYLRSVIN